MQIVGYVRALADREAALLVADGDRIERQSLAPGRELGYSLGDRRCAGVIDDGQHVPCDADAAPHCERHADRWVCARCTGTCLKDEMDCYQDHAVYLAAFAPATFKVGVTRLERLETRFREQGADRAAHIRTVSNGRIAREIEAEIARDIGDRVRVSEKIDGLAHDVDERAWQRLLDEFDVIDRYAFDHGLDLDDRPVSETLLSGTVRGSTGRILVLDRSGGSYAVDMRDLVGYEIDEGAPDRALQSNLATFA